MNGSSLDELGIDYLLHLYTYTKKFEYMLTNFHNFL